VIDLEKAFSGSDLPTTGLKAFAPIRQMRILGDSIVAAMGSNGIGLIGIDAHASDTDAPVVHIMTSPQPGSEVSQGSQVTVRVEEVDKEEVVVEFGMAIKDMVIPFMDDTAPFEAVIPVPEGISGEELGFFARAFDLYGNQGESESLMLSVKPDNVPPTIQHVKPHHGSYVYEGFPLEISAQIMDDVGLRSYRGVTVTLEANSLVDQPKPIEISFNKPESLYEVIFYNQIPEGNADREFAITITAVDRSFNQKTETVHYFCLPQAHLRHVIDWDLSEDRILASELSNDITFMVTDPEGNLYADDNTTRFQITAKGWATFNEFASQGTVISGGGTNQIVVQVEGGQVTLGVTDIFRESVEFTIHDTEQQYLVNPEAFSKTLLFAFIDVEPPTIDSIMVQPPSDQGLTIGSTLTVDVGISDNIGLDYTLVSIKTQDEGIILGSKEHSFTYPPVMAKDSAYAITQYSEHVSVIIPALDPYSKIRIYVKARDLKNPAGPPENEYYDIQESEMTLVNFDYDGDGLPLYAEDANDNGIWDPGETDAAKADTDEDGIDDAEELVAGMDGYITDPTKWDTDGDGFSDSHEIAIGEDPNFPEKVSPNVEIIDPNDGDIVTEGQIISISIESSDNYILSSVELICNDSPVRTETSGFTHAYVVPQGITQLIIEAKATDMAGNTSEDTITLQVIEKPPIEGAMIEGMITLSTGNTFSHGTLKVLSSDNEYAQDVNLATGQYSVIVPRNNWYFIEAIAYDSEDVLYFGSSQVRVQEQDSYYVDITVSLQEQEGIITKGVVLNETGEPVAGATVSIPGQGLSTSTENDGFFIITGIPQDLPSFTVEVSALIEGESYSAHSSELIPGGERIMYTGNLILTRATGDDNDHDGYTVSGGDCDDNDPSIYPGAPDISDGKDNDCDGYIDECLYVFSGDSIQDAIDEASDGNEIIVYPGVYEENIDFSGKAIKLMSTNPNDPNVVAVTIIDGGENELNVVEFSNGEGNDTVLSGFTITNGYAEEGGGIYCYESSPSITNCIISNNEADYGGGIYCGYYSSPIITNCTISGNFAYYYGGGIYCYDEASSPVITNCMISGNSASDYGGGIECDSDSSPVITYCTFIGNSSYYGGGIDCYYASPSITHCTLNENSSEYGGGIDCYESSPTITDCMISGNTASDSGGGIFYEDCSPVITNCTISGNTASYDGGGIYCYDSSPTITNCTISGNTASYDGGGIYCYDDSSPTITDCMIIGNTASDEAGGGIYCYDYTSPTITNCKIIGNSAPYYGGGIYCEYYSSPVITNCTIIGNSVTYDGGGGIYCDYNSSPSITNCTISNNSSFWDGGGICCYRSSTSITNCTIIGNKASYDGGGIYCDRSSLTITNCTINWNRASDDGGGIYCYYASPVITNCTISGNSASDDGGGIYCSSSSPVITNCILWGDSPQEIYGGTSEVRYSDIQQDSGIYPGSNNINADPLFVGSEVRNYYLMPGSPCIDKGTSDNAPSEDKEGIVRPEGLGIDMGAYEYVDPGSCTPRAFIIADQTTGIDTLTVQFDASSSGGSQYSGAVISWDFGDGASEDGLIVSHTYTDYGSYDVSLTITTGCGTHTLTIPELIRITPYIPPDIEGNILMPPGHTFAMGSLRIQSSDFDIQEMIDLEEAGFSMELPRNKWYFIEAMVYDTECGEECGPHYGWNIIWVPESGIQQSDIHVLPMSHPIPGIIDTVEGGWDGSSDALPTEVSLPDLQGITLDNNGGIFITANSSVYGIGSDPNEVRSIFPIAGTRIDGYSGDGGPADQARLNHPYDVAVDDSWRIFIADTYNHRIRMAEPECGTIITIAGTGEYGYSGDEGSAEDARLAYPTGIALDTMGNIFFTDRNNHAIRMIDWDGTISTIAGTGIPGYSGDYGQADQAQLNAPSYIWIDDASNLYVVDEGNHAVRMVDSSGTITTIAGTGIPGYSGDNGQASDAQLDTPSGVTMDSQGNIYISDQGNGRIRMIDPNGIIRTFAGTGQTQFNGDGPIGTTNIDPGKLTIDSLGNLYFVHNNSLVRIIDPNGMVTTIAGIPEWGSNEIKEPFQAPSDMAIYAGEGTIIFVADRLNHRIQMIEVYGDEFYTQTIVGTGVKGFYGDGGSAAAAELDEPRGVAVDYYSGNMYIADTGNRRIRRVNTDGVIDTIAGVGPVEPGEETDAYIIPMHLTVDYSGNVYFTDVWMHGVRMIDPNGIIHTIAGTGSSGYSGDGGEAILASFNEPWGIVGDWDYSGNIYIADRQNHCIRMIDPDGFITTIAGTGVAGDSGDGGLAVDAQLNGPTDISIDMETGNIYITDMWNHKIRMIEYYSGIIYTVAGNGAVGYSGDGDYAPWAKLNHPAGLAIDYYTGALYFSDSFNHCIRTVSPMRNAMDYTQVLGIVLDPDGNPAAGARVYIWGLDQPLYTNAQGMFLSPPFSPDEVIWVDVVFAPQEGCYCDEGYSYCGIYYDTGVEVEPVTGTVVFLGNMILKLDIPE